jgi:DNA transformation protein
MTRSSYTDYVVNDLLGGLEGIRARAMFGAHGVYKDGTMFAIVDEDELFYKVNDATRAEFKLRGSEPIHYVSQGKRITMDYWKLPAEVLEDRELFAEWTEKAIRIAVSALRPKHA